MNVVRACVCVCVRMHDLCMYYVCEVCLYVRVVCADVSESGMYVFYVRRTYLFMRVSIYVCQLHVCI